MKIEARGCKLPARKQWESAPAVVASCSLAENRFDAFTKKFPRRALLIGELVSAIHPAELAADRVIQATFANMLLDAQ